MLNGTLEKSCHCPGCAGFSKEPERAQVMDNGDHLIHAAESGQDDRRRQVSSIKQRAQEFEPILPASSGQSL
jgi:hypothetical protein